MTEQLTEAEIRYSLREAYQGGAKTLTIYSRRQDIGIVKCEWGLAHGFLTKEVREIDEQETHWVYSWTDKAKEL